MRSADAAQSRPPAIAHPPPDAVRGSALLRVDHDAYDGGLKRLLRSPSGVPKVRHGRRRHGILDACHSSRSPAASPRAKSTIARRLAEHGAVIVDADQVVRDVQQPGSPVLAAIAAEFGDGMLRADGSLDRAAPRRARVRRPAGGDAPQRDRPPGGAERVAAAVRRGVRRRPGRGRRLRRAAARRSAGERPVGSHRGGPRAGGGAATAARRAARAGRAGCRGAHRIAGLGRGAAEHRRRRHRDRRLARRARCDQIDELWERLPQLVARPETAAASSRRASTLERPAMEVRHEHSLEVPSTQGPVQSGSPRKSRSRATSTCSTRSLRA